MIALSGTLAILAAVISAAMVTAALSLLFLLCGWLARRRASVAETVPPGARDGEPLTEAEQRALAMIRHGWALTADEPAYPEGGAP